MDGLSYLGDVGAFRANASSNVGLANRARGIKANPEAIPSGMHKAGEFFWIERDRLSSTPASGQWTPLESTAFEALSPASQQTVRNLLWFTQGDATATKAIGSLLSQGKLSVKDRSGVSLLDRLGALTTSPLDSGIDRGKFLKELISQLNDPMLVTQGNRSTCAAAVVQYLAIKAEPADYVAMVAGLVSPNGQAQLPNGQKIKRDGATALDGSGRSSVDQVVQNSLMEYATGGFNSNTGRNEDSTLGLTATRFDQLVEGVMNAPYQTVLIGSDKDLTQAQAIAKMKEATARGTTVPVGLDWKSGGHKILVQGFDQGLVYYYNPWGRIESMAEREFSSRIHNASFR